MIDDIIKNLRASCNVCTAAGVPGTLVLITDLAQVLDEIERLRDFVAETESLRREGLV